jgi:hypothetical protein
MSVSGKLTRCATENCERRDLLESLPEIHRYCTKLLSKIESIWNKTTSNLETKTSPTPLFKLRSHAEYMNIFRICDVQQKYRLDIQYRLDDEINLIVRKHFWILMRFVTNKLSKNSLSQCNNPIPESLPREKSLNSKCVDRCDDDALPWKINTISLLRLSPFRH